MQSITESPFESYSQFAHAVTFSGETLQGQIWWGSAKIISVDEQGTCTPLIRLFSLLICFDLFLEMGQKKTTFTV